MNGPKVRETAALEKFGYLLESLAYPPVLAQVVTDMETNEQRKSARRSAREC